MTSVCAVIELYKSSWSAWQF